VPGGQGLGLTLDVTGHVGMLRERRSTDQFVVLGCGCNKHIPASVFVKRGTTNRSACRDR